MLQTSNLTGIKPHSTHHTWKSKISLDWKELNLSNMSSLPGNGDEPPDWYTPFIMAILVWNWQNSDTELPHKNNLPSYICLLIVEEEVRGTRWVFPLKWKESLYLFSSKICFLVADLWFILLVYRSHLQFVYGAINLRRTIK